MLMNRNLDLRSHSVSHSFIHLFIYLFIHPFIHPAIHSFIHSCSKEIRRRSSGLSFFLLIDSWRLISISTSLFSQGGDAGNVGVRKVRLREEKKTRKKLTFLDQPMYIASAKNVLKVFKTCALVRYIVAIECRLTKNGNPGNVN